MSKDLLVFSTKNFKITIPDEARVTFGPWSPPASAESKYSISEKALSGTLRIYENSSAKASILAVFSGVTGYRDMSIDYEEEVLREEGSIVWKSDKKGYRREEKVSRDSDWVDPLAELGPGEEPV